MPWGTALGSVLYSLSVNNLNPLAQSIPLYADDMETCRAVRNENDCLGLQNNQEELSR